MARSRGFRVLRRLRGELAARRDVDRHLKQLYRAVADLEEFRRGIEPQAQIPSVMAWIAEAELQTSPLVSVVMPTRDRGPYLARAIRSVIAQSYADWELVAVADGDFDQAAATVDAFNDHRVRFLQGRGRGQQAARNQALDAADGELIAYLDDDNVMHRNWLKSVVWAFEQRPRTNVLYGAIVIDDPDRFRGDGPGRMPTAFLYPFDRDELARRNLADISAIAHRAGLSEARFDETIDVVPDWDLLLRLTADEDPLVLPALACFYLTDAPNRLSSGLSAEDELAALRARAAELDRGKVPRRRARGGTRESDERGM
jgi:hypothetical protein